MVTRSRDFPIVGDSFNVGYRFQRYWDTPMASAFFFGELGAGVFLVAAFMGHPPGMLAGLLLTCILKTYFHLSHMGVPTRSWRAIMRPDRSWISRGLLAIVFYGGFGFAYLALTALGWADSLGIPDGLVVLTKWLAVAAALVVATYQGFAMSHSTAIALWSSAVMPLSSLVYAITGGVFVNLVMGWSGVLVDDPATRHFLANSALALCGVLAMVHLSLLHAAHHGSPGGQKSVELLTRTLYAPWFYGVTIALGLALPAALLVVAGESLMAVAIAAAGMLAGYYSFRLLMFKAGVFEPIMSFRP